VAYYSIKDIEHLTGIKAHTIRIWEKRYKIIEPHRTKTNIRYYDDNDLKKILNISVLNHNGYKISKIAGLSDEKINREILGVTHQSGSSDFQIENLIIAMIEFDAFMFEKIFNRSIMNIGFEETILKVIYPFFEKIGILWQTGNISPAQEHFISNLFRQKIEVAIDNIPEHFSDNSKSFVLFLPEGEWHELGLLFYSYLIKKNGHRVIYLGSSLSFDSVKELEQTISFDYILTAVKTTTIADEMRANLHAIAEKFINKIIFIPGFDIDINLADLPHNLVFPTNPEDFKEYLSKNKMA
jgi:MerR family transcriptional regulator, light-induced transcriptional regulator